MSDNVSTNQKTGKMDIWKVPKFEECYILADKWIFSKTKVNPVAVKASRLCLKSDCGKVWNYGGAVHFHWVLIFDPSCPEDMAFLKAWNPYQTIRLCMDRLTYICLSHLSSNMVKAFLKLLALPALPEKLEEQFRYWRHRRLESDITWEQSWKKRDTVAYTKHFKVNIFEVFAQQIKAAKKDFNSMTLTMKPTVVPYNMSINLNKPEDLDPDYDHDAYLKEKKNLVKLTETSSEAVAPRLAAGNPSDPDSDSDKKTIMNLERRLAKAQSLLDRTRRFGQPEMPGHLNASVYLPTRYSFDEPELALPFLGVAEFSQALAGDFEKFEFPVSQVSIVVVAKSKDGSEEKTLLCKSLKVKRSEVNGEDLYAELDDPNHDSWHKVGVARQEQLPIQSPDVGCSNKIPSPLILQPNFQSKRPSVANSEKSKSKKQKKY